MQCASPLATRSRRGGRAVAFECHFQSILKCCVTREIAVRLVLAMEGVERRPR